MLKLIKRDTRNLVLHLPYCRRCGTKLDEDVHFCYKCGTPVTANNLVVPTKLVRPMRKKWLVTVAIASLIAILVAAMVVGAAIFIPISSLNFNQINQDSHPNIDTLNLDLQVDSAQVDIITQNITDKNILIITSAVGSRGFFGSNDLIQIKFNNQTQNKKLTVTTKVTDTKDLFTRNLRITCTVYINPALNLNLNVTTQAGKITLSSEKSVTFQSVNLQAKAGDIEATIQNATIAGPISFKTYAGTVYFGMSQVSVQNNQTVNLQSSAGSTNMDITQTKPLQGNLTVSTVTELGSINLGLKIDGDVAAKIISLTNFGRIHSDLQNFSGDQSPIQSNNYPTAGKIEINSQTNLGNININAFYQSSNGPSIRN